MKFNWQICLCLLSWLSLAQADYAGVWTQEMAVSAAQDSEVLLLDVRSEQEFASGRVPGAKNIPYDELEARLSELRAYSDKTVVLYCHSGRRASIAESYLSANGFTQLYHLQGDMQAWNAKGLAQEHSH
jgi:phage shock protein E